MNHDDILVGKTHSRIGGGNRFVVPVCDRAQKDSRQDLGCKFQLSGHTRYVVSRNRGAQHRRYVQNLDLRLFQLVIRHGAIGGAKVDRTGDHLSNSPAASNRLVIDLDVGMELEVLAKPLGVDRIGKGSTRSIQVRLPKGRQGDEGTPQQQCHSAHHSMGLLRLFPSSTIG